MPALPQTDLATADFNFDLPPELIAERPQRRRDASRLMVLPKKAGAPVHKQFTDLADLLAPGDLLVLNDTRVFPARICGKKNRTGGSVELLLIEQHADGGWTAMAKGKPKAGEELLLDGGLTVRVGKIMGDGFVTIHAKADLSAHLEAHGQVPLPPYIKRPVDAADRERYQTVFARHEGSVAAPTSGLHFTDDLLAHLSARGIEHTFITLHVGPGTFLPVRAEKLSDHVMHAERYEVPETAATQIAATQKNGGRIIACGTTVTRALETAASRTGTRFAHKGDSRLFIHPGYEFRVIDGLVTNFHLPGSTLLMLVSALAGRERILAAYAAAVTEKYRFFSYGDGMLIL